MNCPNCGRETQPTFFCHACDVYLADRSVGERAGVARRLAAQFLDWIAVWVILFAIILIAGLVAGASNSPGLSVGTFFWAFVGYIVFAFWFLAQGKTPGKWFVGIRAARKSDGAVPGLGRMLVRETFGKFASGFFLGLGYFWAIWDPNSQTWHDKIAGTLVVRQKQGAVLLSARSAVASLAVQDAAVPVAAQPHPVSPIQAVPQLAPAMAPPAPTAVQTAAAPAPARSYGSIRCAAGSLAGRRFEVTRQGLLIGRDPAKCQIVVTDEAVSREHAWVVATDEGVVVIDRGSSNGTYVNSVEAGAISKVRLQDGDRVFIGPRGPVFVYSQS